MPRMKHLIFCLLLVYLNPGKILGTNTESCSLQNARATQFLDEANEAIREQYHKKTLAAWQMNTNVTKENIKNSIDVAAEVAEFFKNITKQIEELGYQHIEDEDVNRQVTMLTRLGHDVLSKEDHIKLLDAISAMQANYATLKVCEYKKSQKCSLTLEPHIQRRLSKSGNPEELKYYWKAFYDKAGTPMREQFTTYVNLTRKAAELNGFKSYAEDWVEKYEDPDFEKSIDRTFQRILPFYKNLHAYVRYKLHEHYGADIVPADGNIPIHLLGNMWGQSWEDVIDLFTPYPEKEFLDVTPQMLTKGYSASKIFELGDEFFTSLNMTKLPRTFWKESVLEKPSDREIVCHASAWDLFKIDDVRIKQCTEVNTHYLYVAHHELGHIQYYLQYQHQPAVFRRAPHPGFHEAVGDVVALSVSTPKHLSRIGLLKNGDLDGKSRVNELFKTAMKKVVFLPFAYTLDKYRYAVFRGELKPSCWNCGFWRMRSVHGGVEPPVARTEKDFDPPAKYHVSADVEYLRYFTAHILQFQFHKTMCKKAGQYVEGDGRLTLDQCDIYRSKEAGNAFKKMLQLGASKHWKEALKEFIGEDEMDPSAMLEYFRPLQFWLKEEILRLNAPVGWNITDKCLIECGNPSLR